MKKYLIVLIFISFTNCISGQCLPSKEKYVEYFNSNSIDPIEGIWALNCVTTLYFNGQKVGKSNGEVLSKWAIIRDSEFSFKVCDIGEGQSPEEASNFLAYFEKTAIPGMYTYKCSYENPKWVATANAELLDEVIINYSFDLDKAKLKQQMKSRYKKGYTAKWHFIWTKIYPNDLGKNNNSREAPEWCSTGSGFLIDPKGYIATNYHVVDNAKVVEIDLIVDNQKQSYKAKVISSDKQNDLAIIKIDDDKFQPFSSLPYNFKSTISDVATNVFTLGYPMALSVMGEEVKFTDGKISSKTGYQGDVSTYQISVPIQPGNSGGPLFDYDGNIVGIVNAKILKADNVSYAIKSTYLNNLIDVIPDKIILPNDQSISQKSLTEKIKLLSNYVVLIKVK
jgi:S1-C subfamily serine protease